MPEKKLDAEIKVRGIVGFGVGLAVATAAIAALMWWLSLELKAKAMANDPPLPALLEARVQQEPPEPRLQSDPIGDLARLRAEEAEVLNVPAWVDRDTGIARIPISSAIDAIGVTGRLPSLTLQTDQEGSDSAVEDATE